MFHKEKYLYAAIMTNPWHMLKQEIYDGETYYSYELLTEYKK